MTKRTYQQTDLSRFLRKVRKETNLSTADVAQLTCQLDEPFRISGGFLSQIENGATPSPYKLLTLARIYDVPIIEFFRAMGATDKELGIQDGKSLKPIEIQRYSEKLEQLYSLNKRAFISVSKNIDDRLDEEQERHPLPKASGEPAKKAAVA